MTLYWAAEIVALYAALRMFGVHLNPARVVLAYGTGYVVTRRSLPLAGAAFTEVLLTFALHWVGTPLGPALAAVVTYRLFNLILVSVHRCSPTDCCIRRSRVERHHRRRRS